MTMLRRERIWAVCCNLYTRPIAWLTNHFTLSIIAILGLICAISTILLTWLPILACYVLLLLQLLWTVDSRVGLEYGWIFGGSNQGRDKPTNMWKESNDIWNYRNCELI
jgi:hypothetical protein